MGLARQASRLNETQLSSRLLNAAGHYVENHPFSPFAVGYYNSRRLLELEGSYAWRASAKAISLPISVARAGVISFWLLCLVAWRAAQVRLGRAPVAGGGVAPLPAGAGERVEVG